MRCWRWRKEPLVQAFALSILFHLELLVISEIGMRQGWWNNSLMPAWMREMAPKILQAKAQPTSPTKLDTKKEDPLLYVEVDPSVATAEPPPETPLYSARNSLAANPDPKKDTKTPKVDGKQTKIIKTVDTLKPNPKPVEVKPTPPPPKPSEDPVVNTTSEAKPEPKNESKPETQPKPKVDEVKPVDPTPEGDLNTGTPVPKVAEAKPETEVTPATPTSGRRRTLPSDRRDPGMLAGQKMKQDGGVSRGGRVALDVKESPFGNYDEQVIIAIQQRWFQLLDQQDFTRGRTGKVVLEFRMSADGKVTNMRVAENTAGDLLAIVCQKAVMDPAPYAPWPAEMKRKIGVNYREVRFTFYYE